MSKSIKSNGEINAAVLAMCQREGGLSAYPRGRVDEALTADRLKACDYSTLALLVHSYRQVFGEIHCPAQHQLEVKAMQSSKYRAFLATTSGKRRTALAPDEDPFAVLDAAMEKAKANTETTAAEPVGRKGNAKEAAKRAKEEEAARLRDDVAAAETAHRPKAEKSEQHEQEVDALLAQTDDEQ